MKRKSQLGGYVIERQGEVIFTLSGDICKDIASIRPEAEHAFSIVTDIFTVYQAVTDEPRQIVGYYKKCILLINAMHASAPQSFSWISLKYILPRIKSRELPVQDQNVQVLVRSPARNIGDMDIMGELVIPLGEKFSVLKSLLLRAHQGEMVVNGKEYHFDLYNIEHALATVEDIDIALQLVGNIFYQYLETTTDSTKIAFFFDRSIARLLALVPEKRKQIDSYGLGVFATLCRKIIDHELLLDRTMADLLKKAPGDYQAIGDDEPFWELWSYLHENKREDLLRLLNSE